MKNNIMKFLSVMFFLLVAVITTIAQPLPTELGPDGVMPGSGAPTVQCSAPVGNGYWILLALAVGYGLYRTWQMRKAEKTA